jgi:peptidoglycan/xylan/chitin deacetylase (PgdA/CDA1 family)
MRDYKYPILMYHSIEKMPKSTVMRSLHVSPIKFKFQMWLLKILGYKGISIRELAPYLLGKKHGKVVGITFDDGYQNILINAAPILSKYGFTATSYIVSKRIGRSNEWDMKNHITQRPLMNKYEIEKWLNYGMDIGAHSQTHPDLTNISNQRINKEINQCKLDLEKLFDIKVVDFCYPYGRFNNLVYESTSKAGYFSATTMIRGRASKVADMLELPRIPITNRTLPHLFLTKILTSYEDMK